MSLCGFDCNVIYTYLEFYALVDAFFFSFTQALCAVAALASLGGAVKLNCRPACQIPVRTVGTVRL